MSEFIFLYRRAKEWAGSPEESQKQMQKWRTWLKDLGDKGHLKEAGQPLERAGKIVRRNPNSVTDGPFAEKDIIGGYSIIVARDLNEAAELAQGCPIFDIEAGGFVEVRPVMKM